MGLNPKFLRGQAYDGAANMGDIAGGVQAIMKDKLAVKTGDGNVFALYVQCPPHQIKLVVLRAAQTKPPIRTINLFGFVSEIYNFFNYSNRRWNLFLNIVKCEADSDDRNGDKTLAFTGLIAVTNDCNEYECDLDNNFQQQPSSETLFSSEASKDDEQS